jgi:hypothetical protein
MLALVVADGSQSLPGVKFTGIVIGLLLLYAAIRAMFGKGGKGKR